MNARDALAAIAGGTRHAGLLGNCRCEWGGGEAYGEEAILELFREHPVDIADGEMIQDATALACFKRDTALFADLHEGRIGRLWRIGPGGGAPIEPAVAVASDPDLRQARGDVLFRAADHPGLASDAATAVIAGGNALIGRIDHGPLHRARAFVLRALGTADRAAALYSVQRLGGGAVRTSGFGYAAALVGAHEMVAIDPPTPREWTPRL